ncbi:ABC transporter ATP-binding protein [Acidobacteriota bacterium]
MISAKEITKKFGDQVVLDSLSLQVDQGELYAILGPNGAGKTTLLKCMVGLYVPIEGTITIDGLDRRRDHLAIRRFTAWLADQPFMYSHFTGRAWLEMVADIYGVPAETRDIQIEELLEIFDLKDLGRKKIAYYSTGQYKKLALCATLVTNARLFLMDEPFTGEIDPPGVAAFKQILKEMAKRRDITVVFSTQMIEQAEQLAERIGILHDGKIIASGTAAELKEQFEKASLEEVLTSIVQRDPTETTQRFLQSFAKGESEEDQI